MKKAFRIFAGTIAILTLSLLLFNLLGQDVTKQWDGMRLQQESATTPTNYTLVISPKGIVVENGYPATNTLDQSREEIEAETPLKPGTYGNLEITKGGNNIYTFKANEGFYYRLKQIGPRLYVDEENGIEYSTQSYLK